MSGLRDGLTHCAKSSGGRRGAERTERSADGADLGSEVAEDRDGYEECGVDAQRPRAASPARRQAALHVQQLIPDDPQRLKQQEPATGVEDRRLSGRDFGGGDFVRRLRARVHRDERELGPLRSGPTDNALRTGRHGGAGGRSSLVLRNNELVSAAALRLRLGRGRGRVLVEAHGRTSAELSAF